MFTSRSASARQTFPSVLGRSSINTVNSLATCMVGTSFASLKMQNASSVWCDVVGGIIRPALNRSSYGYILKSLDTDCLVGMKDSRKLTGCEAQEDARRQSTLPFPARGDNSHAKTALAQ